MIQKSLDVFSLLFLYYLDVVDLCKHGTNFLAPFIYKPFKT